jgi:hypothetical protein
MPGWVHTFLAHIKLVSGLFTAQIKVMSIYTDNPNVFNQPLRLSIEERSNPRQVFTEFFVDYSLSECRDWLSRIVNTCLTSYDVEFNDPDKRDDLLHFVERLEAILEATTIPTELNKNLSESAMSVENSKETKADSNINIDLNSLQKLVADIQVKVAELAAMITKALSGAAPGLVC